ncbi:uncharacterized protein CTRU02_210912 [Colletotrichum truncatum]|uniref:Uncharacterized protein n=1 Tax=Colletotrichum truncatum TaxID=5467 RepID=A0ACC3YSI5_COLTU|nr:uncharacterized protein CTRU02_03604 [Colletotrichum truncatum]KAF6796626.1 hypothetical protein CTRU02_03604 [Colletotrichum truncatum]
MSLRCPKRANLDHFSAKLLWKWKTCAFCSIDLSQVQEPDEIDLTNTDDFETPTATISSRTRLSNTTTNPIEQALYIPDTQPDNSLLTALIKGSEERTASIQQTQKKPVPNPTVDIIIHLWLASFYVTDIDGISIRTYTRVQSVKKFIRKSQFLLTSKFTSHTDMMSKVLVKFTSEKQFLDRNWKAMPVTPKNPTDMHEFRGVAYEAEDLFTFLREASITPDKDVYTIALVSESQVDPLVTEPQVSKKLRLKQHTLDMVTTSTTPLPTVNMFTKAPTPKPPTRIQTRTERKPSLKAQEVIKQEREGIKSRKRTHSQVEQQGHTDVIQEDITLKGGSQEDKEEDEIVVRQEETIV